jgi:NADH:ubiquinone oxidoreductase subunit 2 (subunit N)
LATLGIPVLISANDFIALYLGCGLTGLAFCAVSAFIIIPFVFAPSPITNAATAAAQSLS